MTTSDATHAGATDQLKAAVQRAIEEHPTRCNRSTAAVAHAFGYTELDRKLANAQIRYMEQYWQTITAEQAQALADRGQLVVAGQPGILRADGRRGFGHTAVVYPGGMTTAGDGKRYPRIAGGSFNSVTPGVPGRKYSEGARNAHDAWGRRVGGVQYYTPAPEHGAGVVER
jgi:hypothetical protein